MGQIYYQCIDITDFGPYITKLILGLPHEIDGSDLQPDAFSVYVEIRDKTGRLVTMPKSFIERDILLPSRGYRPVSAAYLCDLNGIPVKENSRFVALEMLYGPIHRCSSALTADFQNINGHESYTFSDYRITLTGCLGREGHTLEGLVFDVCAGIRNPKRDRFMTGVSEYAPLPLRYGYYVPEQLDSPKPLIVFLHGAGEGGQDLPIAWSGNKITEFTEPWMQKIFGGAFVLVPQCDTMWLNDGSGVYNDSGKSMYTEALKALIDEFVKKRKAIIDPDRIYIGGDSNGGFMTMRMLMSYPAFFAAAFPICEAMPDKRITDEDIEHLTEIPIWFTHSKADTTVKPELYVIPTYKRLIQAGADNCHFTFWDKITDIHAGFRQENGEPYEYNGHFAWIPVLNDDCRTDFDGSPVVWEGQEVSLMNWMAAQKRNKK